MGYGIHHAVDLIWLYEYNERTKTDWHLKKKEEEKYNQKIMFSAVAIVIKKKIKEIKNKQKKKQRKNYDGWNTAKKVWSKRKKILQDIWTKLETIAHLTEYHFVTNPFW